MKSTLCNKKSNYRLYDVTFSCHMIKLAFSSWKWNLNIQSKSEHFKMIFWRKKRLSGNTSWRPFFPPDRRYRRVVSPFLKLFGFLEKVKIEMRNFFSIDPVASMKVTRKTNSHKEGSKSGRSDIYQVSGTFLMQILLFGN